MKRESTYFETHEYSLAALKRVSTIEYADGRTDGRTDNVKTVYPLQTKFAGGINI